MPPRILLAVFLLATPCIADDYDSPPLKFIYEQYDEAVIQNYQREGNDWITRRIFFCRKGKVIAERYFDERFIVTVKPDNKINIQWEDYSTYQRSIDIDFLFEGPGVIEDEGNMNWFQMQRRMTDLRVD